MVHRWLRVVCTHLATLYSYRSYCLGCYTRHFVAFVSVVLPVRSLHVGSGNDLQKQIASLVAHSFALRYHGAVIFALPHFAHRQHVLGRLRFVDAGAAQRHLLGFVPLGTYPECSLEARARGGLMQRKDSRMKAWFHLFTVWLLLCALTVPIQADVRESSFSKETEDALSGVLFFGESTTAHLSRVGGVLDTDEGRGKVLRDESGTRCLDMRILSSPVFYGGEKISFAEAIESAQPRVLVLSFGLNGISRWSRDPEAFLRNYRALIDGIRSRSPNTYILLQSVYPVGENTVFSLPVAEINQQICTLNQSIESLAGEYENVGYVNTAALLTDTNGALNAAYDHGDGIHLTNTAYRILLAALCEQIQKIQLP